MAENHCDRCDKDARRVDLVPFQFMGGTGLRHKRPCEMAQTVKDLASKYDLDTGRPLATAAPPSSDPTGIDEGFLELFVMQRTEIDQLEARLKEVKGQHSLIEEQLFDQIQALNLKSYPHDTLGRFAPRAQLYVNLAKPTLNDEGELVNEDAQAKLEEWSKGEKDPAGNPLFNDLFGWVIKSSRLKTVVKDRIAENLDPPPGVEHGFLKRITYTPIKK